MVVAPSPCRFPVATDELHNILLRVAVCVYCSITMGSVWPSLPARGVTRAICQRQLSSNASRARTPRNPHVPFHYGERGLVRASRQMPEGPSPTSEVGASASRG